LTSGLVRDVGDDVGDNVDEIVDGQQTLLSKPFSASRISMLAIEADRLLQQWSNPVGPGAQPHLPSQYRLIFSGRLPERCRDSIGLPCTLPRHRSVVLRAA